MDIDSTLKRSTKPSQRKKLIFGTLLISIALIIWLIYSWLAPTALAANQLQIATVTQADFVIKIRGFGRLKSKYQRYLTNTDSAMVEPQHFNVDLGQLEQALINLIKNAFEAGGRSAPTLSWQQHKDKVVIKLLDSGTGITNPENLFVPFYSTKAQGAGIGLVISRELIRNQGGQLQLLANPEGQGTRVLVTLPR